MRAILSHSVMLAVSLSTAACGRSGFAPLPPSSGADHSAPSTGWHTLEPIVITPASVADAFVDETYRATLKASGGVGAPYHFRLVGGALPSSLQLDDSGVVSGTPGQTGSFAFVVAASDAVGDRGERAYVLRVEERARSRRWLAFSTFVSSSSYRSALSLVDYTQDSPAPQRLADGIVGAGAAYFTFSPDGHWLSYPFRAQLSEPTTLYAIDTSTEMLGRKLTIDTGTAIDFTSWCPDASKLVYRYGTQRELRAVDFTPGAPAAPITVAGDVDLPVVWSDHETLLYVHAGKLNIVHFAGTTASAPAVLDAIPAAAEILILSLSPTGDRAWLWARDEYWLADLATHEVTALGNAASLSPEFDRILMPRGGHREIIAVDGIRLGNTIQTVTESPQQWRDLWAHHHSWLFTLADGHVDITDGMGAARPVGGGYLAMSSVFAYAGTQFSPDDALVAFDDGTQVWLSALTDGAPAPAVPVPQSVNALPSFAFAPDAGSLALGSPTPQIVDLRDPAAPRAHPIATAATSGNFKWSADSAYLGMGALLDGNLVLLVLDARAPDGVPKRVVDCAITPAPCVLSDFLFQP
jgi:hypothetical protein